LSKNEVLVIEDSENGLIAVKNAGLKVLVTVNEYTKNENLKGADAIVNSLGDQNEKTVVLAGNLKLSDGIMVHLNDLLNLGMS